MRTGVCASIWPTAGAAGHEYIPSLTARCFLWRLDDGVAEDGRRGPSRSDGLNLKSSRLERQVGQAARFLRVRQLSWLFHRFEIRALDLTERRPGQSR